MMKKKTIIKYGIIAAVFVVLLILFIVVYSNRNNNVVLSYDQSSVKVLVGDKADLIPNVKGKKNKNYNLKYSVSSNIAKIDRHGKFYALETGTVEVTVKCKGSRKSDVTLEVEIVKPSEGIEYEVINDEYAVVKGIGTCTDKTIVIASKYNGVFVTEIDYDFRKNSPNLYEQLKNLIIPGTLTTIPDKAFWAFENLQRIDVCLTDTEIENEGYIGYQAFAYSGLQFVTIPSGVISIDLRAFEHCYDLINVNFAKNSKLKYIEAYAFETCHNLISIVIPSGVRCIGQNAFRECKELRYAIIPQSVELIESGAFVTFAYWPMTTIYCEAKSEPDSWTNGWSSANYNKIIWGYTKE